jgi:hypothetical protein
MANDKAKTTEKAVETTPAYALEVTLISDVQRGTFVTNLDPFEKITLKPIKGKTYGQKANKGAYFIIVGTIEGKERRIMCGPQDTNQWLELDVIGKTNEGKGGIPDELVLGWDGLDWYK